MRTLTLDEVGFVSGGDDEPMQEVVVNGRRMSPEDIQNMMDFLKRHTQMDGGGRFAGDGGGGEVLDEVVIEAARDYCGNKDFNAPDIVPKSCKQHDKDYSKDSELSRKEADDRFLDNMKKELMERHPEMPKWVRDSIANTYYKAVRENGHDSYKGKGVNDRVVREGDDIPRVPRF